MINNKAGILEFIWDSQELSSGFKLQHDKFSGNQELQFKLVSGEKGVGINSLKEWART